MLTLFCLAGLVVLVVAHEYLVSQGTKRQDSVVATRRVVLFVVLALAVAFGGRAQVSTRVQSVWNGLRAEPPTASWSGDPFLQEALGAQHPERPFPELGGPEDIRSWQTHVTELLRVRAAFVPSTQPTVAIRVVEEEEIGNVRRTLLEFTSWDGTQIPAYLHRPTEAANAAAVLVVPGHGAGIRATAGIKSPDYQHAAALELARRGYVTLTPELRGFGMLTPNGEPTHRSIAHAALATGSFYKAIIVRDLSLGLTVLQQSQGVDPSRLAVAGTSLGGELAVFLGVLDPRARVVISHSYGGGIGPVEAGAPVADIVQGTLHGCHTIPGINQILYREDWFRLLAPRALQVARGSNDVGRRADAFQSRIAHAFARLDAHEQFEFSVHAGDHEFFVEAAVQFLARWL